MFEVTKPLASATILVADDQEPNRVLLDEILGAEGYRVICAEDGMRALEQFARFRPDLALLDVMMPKFNGLEVCRKIKEHPDTCLVPIIIVTALSASEDRIRGIEAGADDFLTRPVDRIQLLARVRSLLRLKAHTDELERAESVLFALAESIEAKDAYTQGHCQRLSDYSVQLGRRVQLSEEYIVALRRAGVVHDIGKIAVPESILLKPGRLTADEWEIMRQQPVVGERICSPLKSFRLVLPIIRHHHEKMDGSGYPDGLRGEQIPFTARILQIVDVYDALATDRPYRPALSPEQALHTMETEVRKGWWDPDLFCQFKHLIEAGEELKVQSVVDQLTSHVWG